MPVDVTPFTSRANGDTAQWDVPLDAALTALAVAVNTSEVVASAGNGTTDQTAQIQAAIDTCAATVMPGLKFQSATGVFQGGAQANGGGVVLLGAGVYAVSNLVLKHRVTLRGSGGTVLRQIAASTGPVITNLRDGTAHAQYCTVQDLTIDGNKAAQVAANAGIVWQGDTTNNYTSPLDEDYDVNCRTSNVYIFNCKGNGITMTGAGDNRISDVKIRSCDGVGLYSFQDNHISNVDIGWSGLQGMVVAGESCQITNVKCWYSGALVPSSGAGFYLTADSGVMSGCNAQDNTAQGFLFDGAFGWDCSALLADSNSRNSAGTYPGFDVFSSGFNKLSGVARNRYSAGGATGAQASALRIRSTPAASPNTINIIGATGVWGTNAAAMVQSGSTTAGNNVFLNGADVNGTSPTQFVSSSFNFPTDGVTSCNTAFTALLAAIPATGGTIVLDGKAAPVYAVTSVLVLPSGVNLTSTGNAVLTSTAGTVRLNSNSTVKNITLKSTGTSTLGPIVDYAANSLNTVIRNVVLDGTTHGVYCNVSGVKNARVESCLFRGNQGYGVLWNDQSWNTDGVKILNNTFEATMVSDAIAFNWPNRFWTPSGRTYGGQNITISGNTIRTGLTSSSVSSGFGVSIAGGHNVTIINNIVKGTRNQGIHVEDHSSNISIIGNTVDVTGGGAGPTTGCHGISIMSFSNNITITGNTVMTAGNDGINFTYSSTQTAGVAAVTGNTVRNCGDSGISIGGTRATDTITAMENQSLTVTGNICETNGAAGINLSGGAPGVRVEGNVCNNNTGAGLQVSSGKHGLIAQRNTLTNNAGGNLALLYVVGAPLPVVDYVMTIDVASVATTGTAPIPIALLGLHAEGKLVLYGQRSGGRVTMAYNVAWNGTVLRCTPVMDQVFGGASTGLGIVTPSMAGKMLQFALTDGATVDGTLTVTALFQGTILYDGDAGGGTPPVVSNAVVVTGTAPPNAGKWPLGALCVNTGATPNGWRCTTAGTPGSWTAF